MSLEFEFAVSGVRGVDLEALDVTTSDPYVLFKFGDKKKMQTEVVNKNCNPTFKFADTVKLTVSPFELQSVLLRVECWDKDRGLNPDDLIGLFEVPLYDVVTGPSQFNVMLKLPKKKVSRGRLSFLCVARQLAPRPGSFQQMTSGVYTESGIAFPDVQSSTLLPKAAPLSFPAVVAKRGGVAAALAFARAQSGPAARLQAMRALSAMARDQKGLARLVKGGALEMAIEHVLQCAGSGTVPLLLMEDAVTLLALAGVDATRSYRVTVGTKDHLHHYYGKGSPECFLIDGVPVEKLRLVCGHRYTFVMETDAQHVFYLSRHEEGTVQKTRLRFFGRSQAEKLEKPVIKHYDVKQDVQGTGNYGTPSTLVFTPQSGVRYARRVLSDTIYMCCRVPGRALMGGRVKIVGPEHGIDRHADRAAEALLAALRACGVRTTAPSADATAAPGTLPSGLPDAPPPPLMPGAVDPVGVPAAAVPPPPMPGAGGLAVSAAAAAVAPPTLEQVERLKERALTALAALAQLNAQRHLHSREIESQAVLAALDVLGDPASASDSSLAAACIVLRVLIGERATAAALAAAHQVVERVTTAMAARRTSFTVMTEAALLLRALAARDDAQRERLLALGAVPALLDTVAMYGANPLVLRGAAEALEALTQRPGVVEAILAAGGDGVLLRTTQQCPAPEAIAACVRVLARLMSGMAPQSALDVIATVLRSLQQHAEHVELLQSVAQAAPALAVRPDHQVLLAEQLSGLGVPLVTGLLQHVPRSVAVDARVALAGVVLQGVLSNSAAVRSLEPLRVRRLLKAAYKVASDCTLVGSSPSSRMAAVVGACAALTALDAPQSRPARYVYALLGACALDDATRTVALDRGVGAALHTVLQSANTARATGALRLRFRDKRHAKKLLLAALSAVTALCSATTSARLMDGPLMTQLLEVFRLFGSKTAVLEAAAPLLAQLGGSDHEALAALERAGLVRACIVLLGSPSAAVCAHGIRGLLHMCTRPENRAVALLTGAVERVLQLSARRDVTSDPGLTELALRLLAELSAPNVPEQYPSRGGVTDIGSLAGPASPAVPMAATVVTNPLAATATAPAAAAAAAGPTGSRPTASGWPARFTVTLQLSGRNLAKKDLFGKSDPFLVFSVVGEDAVPTYKTEVIKSDLNPHWQRFTVSGHLLCQYDPDRPLRIECFDWNRSGDHESMGSFVATLRQLAQKAAEFRLIEPARVGKSGYTDSGSVVVDACQVLPE